MEWIYRICTFLAQANIPVESTPKVVPGSQPPLQIQSGNMIVMALEFVYCIICIVLIIIVMTQTSKSEGLSGTLGGSTQSIFRGKKSFEEKLGVITSWLAGAFVFGSFVIFMIIKYLMR